MTNLKHTRAERLWLKNHPDLNERWLQDIVAKDPSILDLGDLVVVERERKQEHAGRLDLLLADDKDETRYEVELMLGATDESHIIRCIEYWDIERRRYPAYEHIAVLLAEDITSRFLNVLGLFAGNIPLVALQLSALQIDDKVILNFVKVLDQRQLRTDDTVVAQQPATRKDWEEKLSPDLITLLDNLFSVIEKRSNGKWHLNYNKNHIGLTDGARARNFVVFQPGRKHIRVRVDLTDALEWVSRLEDTGLTADEKKGKRVRINLTPALFNENQEIITELLGQAVAEVEG